jgi:hypothetical protein
VQHSRAHILFTACFVATNCALAQSATLSTEAKLRMTQVVSEGLQSGDITKKQHSDFLQWVNSEPCRGVALTASESRLKAVAFSISEVEGFPNSRVLAYYEYRGWHVIFTDASSGDERYLVYNGDPTRRLKPVDSWAGAFTIFETTELRDSIVRKVPNIPRKLADCAAWQVTLGQ